MAAPLPMKGIVLAGGSGTRLHPITRAVSKQLLPIYDKPMVFYPLSTLMLAGIRDILVISTPRDLPQYRDLLGDGKDLGIKLTYAEQLNPGGLAQAFIIGRKFIGKNPVTLVLGDNVFYGHGLAHLLQESVRDNRGGTIFGYYVRDPERYGVAEFDASGKVVNIEEKPKVAKSNYAVVGLYIYDNEIVDIAAKLKPSARGELEITAVNNEYLRRDKLTLAKFGRGTAWLDTGTHASMMQAAEFVRVVEERQGWKIGCIKEIAWRRGFIDDGQLQALAAPLQKNGYGDYLLALLTDRVPATER